MKKIITLFTSLLTTLCLTAQSPTPHIQGITRTDKVGSSIGLLDNSRSDLEFSLDKIENWTGTGSKRAALLIQWEDEKKPDAMVWGYKWDGESNGEEMIIAIAKADPRFFIITNNGNWGLTIGGFGFDINQKNTITLTNGEISREPIDGILEIENTEYDNWYTEDSEDHWASGWNSSYWSYSNRESYTEPFQYGSTSAKDRILEDGSWDGWYYCKDFFTNTAFSNSFTPAPAVSTSIDSNKRTRNAYRFDNRLYNLEIGSSIEQYTISGALISKKKAREVTEELDGRPNTIIRIISSQGVEIIK
ncbi:MAG: hypothetical protein ACRC6R_05840 [Bacteroidales bacterium]